MCYAVRTARSHLQAMIEDLKADSARWDSERRAQSARNSSGGIHTSRDATGVLARHSSNSPAVQYRYSETHQSRQHHGPTEAAFQDAYARDQAYDGPRYPGTGAPGYSGASAGGYPQQQYPPASGGGSYGYPQAQQSPPPDPRYAAAAQPSMMAQGGFQADTPYVATGANMRGYNNDPYTAARIPTTGASSQQPTYASAGPGQPGYPATANPYQPYNQVPPTGTQSYTTMHPQDTFYGRGAYIPSTHSTLPVPRAPSD